MRRVLLPFLLLLTACDLDSIAGKRPSAVVTQPAESCDPADVYLESSWGPALSRPTAAGAHYEVLPGVTMPPHVAARVARIDESFARRTGKHLTVVSGTRDTGRQARAMVRVMQLGGSLTKLYEDRESALEIKQAYQRALAAKKSVAEATSAVQAALQSQIDRGIYISAHLRAGAVDIRNTTMTESERKAFRAAVREVDQVSLLEEHRPPHYHLEID